MKLIPYGKHHLEQDDVDAVVKVLRSNFLTQGPAVELFEKAIADYVGVKYAVAVTNGTAALHIAALTAGILPGDNFVTSPITFVATANAGIYAGGAPLFADIEPETANLSPMALKKLVDETDNIKAILPVHFGGLPCKMEEIKLIADNIGAVIIEDAAHALGGSYANGKKVGSCCHSLMTIFSFHPVKNIAAGEGGMITTNDENVYRKLLRLRSHGINKLDDAYLCPDEGICNGIDNPWYYEMQELGFNYRITDIQSALGTTQLKKLPKFLDKRITLAKNYDKHFANFDNCKPVQSGMRDKSGNHLYVLQINFGRAGISRAELMIQLREKGVGTQVHYIPVPAHPYYRNLGINPVDFPNSQKYYREALSIPLYYDLSSNDQQKVVQALSELVG